MRNRTWIYAHCIEAVSQEDFIAWVTETKTKLAMNDKNTFAKANTE